jgi:hypothetical protein
MTGPLHRVAPPTGRQRGAACTVIGNTIATVLGPGIITQSGADELAGIVLEDLLASLAGIVLDDLDDLAAADDLDVGQRIRLACAQLIASNVDLPTGDTLAEATLRLAYAVEHGHIQTSPPPAEENDRV